VARFELIQEVELLALRDELASGRYRPGPYRVFTVHDPVRRSIASLGFRDRVVQHALMLSLEPGIVRTLAPQTHACIVGRGSHRALALVREFVRHCRWCLRLDVQKFFPSIDHTLLREALSRQTQDRLLRWLCDLFLELPGPYERSRLYMPGDDLFAVARPHGLPIGNLTSQWWANLYLSPLDHLLAKVIGIRAFARYMDDIVIFGDDRTGLEAVWRTCEAHAFALRLRLHPRKCRITATREGVRFLGFTMRQTFGGGVSVRLRRESIERFRARMARLMVLYGVGAVGPEEVRSRIAAWSGHARHGDTRALCERLLGELVFQRRSDDREEGCSPHDLVGSCGEGPTPSRGRQCSG
jgi:retron-type reverse transcriptase